MFLTSSHLIPYVPVPCSCQRSNTLLSVICQQLCLPWQYAIISGEALSWNILLSPNATLGHCPQNKQSAFRLTAPPIPVLLTLQQRCLTTCHRLLTAHREFQRTCQLLTAKNSIVVIISCSRASGNINNNAGNHNHYSLPTPPAPGRRTGYGLIISQR